MEAQYWFNLEICATLIIFGLVTYILIKISKLSLHHDLRARDVTKGHHWSYTGNLEHHTYCSVCETLIMTDDGAFCGSCGVCADQPDCITAANNSLICKKISLPGNNLKHHWIKGNLPSGSICEVCDEECGAEIGLSDFRCCWCQNCVHTLCINKLSEICDCGNYRKFIVPPNHIKLKANRIRKQLVVKEITSPAVSDWCPVIVLVNCTAGSYEGEQILSSFRAVLNSAQVIDLATKSPEEALEWCRLIHDTVCRIIVAGGDGTVGWVFDTIRKMKLENPPMVSILPLGTGNDLSRILQWGESHSGSVSAHEYLEEVRQAQPAKLDRWLIHFTPPKLFGGLRAPSRELYMNNYMSIGVDALVTLNFHRARESPFYIFNSRIINKFIYFSYGTKDVLYKECKNLEEHLDLFMDNKKVHLPELEALVVLNIPYWGAGVKPWTMGQGGDSAPKQDINDGKLEVFCVSSSFHIGQLQIGLTEPIRIGQCSSLEVHIKDAAAPMQVDGEPWEQHPGVISINFNHEASVLIKN